LPPPPPPDEQENVKAIASINVAVNRKQVVFIYLLLAIRAVKVVSPFYFLCQTLEDMEFGGIVNL
jgi:hypothetical protein